VLEVSANAAVAGRMALVLMAPHAGTAVSHIRVTVAVFIQ
jgi:hypothetical protein